MLAPKPPADVGFLLPMAPVDCIETCMGPGFPPFSGTEIVAELGLTNAFPVGCKTLLVDNALSFIEFLYPFATVSATVDG